MSLAGPIVPTFRLFCDFFAGLAVLARALHAGLIGDRARLNVLVAGQLFALKGKPLMLTEPTLLVVDDEDAICEGCRRIFSRQGFDVRKCNDASEGLSLATQGDYTAILLDIKMPEMDGLHFLEALRKENSTVPVVLMTGYPSIPNAASAIRLGASDYVTKPFTPEEISQAVHRLLHVGKSDASAEPAATVAASKSPYLFYRDAWCQASGDGVVRAGAMAVRPGVTKIESVRLPRIGEVVYQGLPLAAMTIAGQSQHTIPSPVSGVVVAVNDLLANDSSPLLTDPCGEGWIASISPTRLDEEMAICSPRPVILLTQDRASAQEQADKLRRLGCDVCTIADASDVEAAQKTTGSGVLLFDAAASGTEGPGIVGAVNAQHPSMKVVVFGATDGLLEPAYRIRRIFYYAVEPFADNEIADILAAAFQAPPSPPLCVHRTLAQTLGSLSITNRNRTRVRLMAAPGLLRHEDGVGQLLRHKLMQQRFPLESSPSQTDITPMNILSAANHCDRLIILLAQDIGRLPGSVTRDNKAEYVALVGKGADKVTTLLVQPSGVEASPLAFESGVTEALAEHLMREMASC
jgi:FixJ family two-component response regulator/glycine cleavage system H lipoate-binding protein